MRCARALPTLQLMPAASSRRSPVATPLLGGLPGKTERPHPFGSPHAGHPIHHHVAGPSSVDPDKFFGPLRGRRACGKIGCGRSPRSTQLGAASPKISLIRGTDGGAAHCCHEHEGPTLFHPCSVPAGDRVHVIRCAGRISMMKEVDDAELVVARIAALDLGKAGLEACVRVPSPQRPGRRMQELRGYGTTTAQLLEMVAWLRQWGVQRAVMESTSTYWKGVYYLLEAEGFECWLVNAREVKNVPGRAKTDRADAAWLAKVAERGMCRPSLVQPPEIRRLRDLTRYRRALVQDRTREQQRVEKLLEDAQIKISAVLSNLHGVTGRAIMDALIAGERDPRTLARLAKASARKKTDRLEEALRGFFTEHHATILQMMLDNSDRISAQIAVLDARIAEAIGPFSRPAARLADIPGVSTV